MPKSQRHMMDEASRRIAEANETFLELLPTMRRKELEKLIEKRPALWGRFAGYLTSGHVFVDDPGAKAHATKKKSPAQLDREIADVLAGKRSHATTKGLSAVEDALGYTPDPGTVRRAEAVYGDYSTNELRREIQSLEDQFEMAGGRGVGLADRLDAARIALALRGSKKSHATKKTGATSGELTAAQRAYVALFEQDVREHPLAYKAMVRDDPAKYALQTITGLDDREVRESTRELRAERKKVAKLAPAPQGSAHPTRFWRVRQGAATTRVSAADYSEARARAREIGFKSPDSIMLDEG